MGFTLNTGRARGGAWTRALPNGGAGKLGASLVLLLLLAAGLFFFAFISRGLWPTLRTYQWQATHCRIISSKAVNKAGDGRSDVGAPPYRFDVEYSYTYRGQTHRSTTYQLHYDGSAHNSTVQRLVQQYPAGSAATCYVNPDDTMQAVLQRHSLWFGLILLLPLGLVIVGAGGLTAVWWPRGSTNGGEADEATSEARLWGGSSGGGGEGGGGEWGLMPVMILFSLFLVIGLGFTWLLLIHPLWRVWDARSWTAVPAIVEASSVQSHNDTDGTTYSLDLLYRYRVAGRVHRSTRYHFIKGTSSGRAGKQRIIDRLPLGAKTTAYVNPDDPDEAVLDRSPTWIVLVGLFPLLFVGVGLGGLIAAPRVAANIQHQRVGGGMARRGPAVGTVDYA